MSRYVELAARTSDYAVINSLKEGHKAGAGGQLEQIPIEFIHEQFTSQGFDAIHAPTDKAELKLLSTIQPQYELRIYSQL